MTGALRIYLLLPIFLLVLILGTDIESARKRCREFKRYENLYYMEPHEKEYDENKFKHRILKRDSSKEQRVRKDFHGQYKTEKAGKRSASECVSELSTTLNQQDISDNLVRRNQEIYTSTSFRPLQSGSTSTILQHTEIPVIVNNSNGYSTTGRYSQIPISLEMSKPNQDINAAFAKEQNGEPTSLRDKTDKNINSMDNSKQLSQMAPVHSFRNFCKNDKSGDKKFDKSGGEGRTPNTAGPKSVNEVYGLAVKAERKYEEGVSTEKGGVVKFSELSAELLSELERVEKFGNVKQKSRDEVPSVLELLPNTDGAARELVKQPSTVAVVSDRQSRAFFTTVADTASTSEAEGVTSSTSYLSDTATAALQVRPLRGADHAQEAFEGADSIYDEEGSDDAGDAAEADAAFRDVVVALGGNPVLGRCSVD